MQNLGAVIFEGGTNQSFLEKEMHSCRKRLTVELIEKCLAEPRIGRVVLATNYDDLREELSGYPIDFYDTKQMDDFHYGEVLQAICQHYGLEKVITCSGASAPLMTREELALLSEVIAQNENIVLSNNPQSADLVAFSPTGSLGMVDLPAIDNPLPWILKEQAGLSPCLLPVTTGFNFDLDTPLDLVYLSLHDRCPAEIVEITGKWDLIRERVRRANDVLHTPNAEVFMAGRVGPWVMSHLNEQVRCRLRVVSEERGMKALGRIDRGEVYSLLGKMIDMMGFNVFFHYLESFCHVAFIDTRVLFSHWKLKPNAEDRFYSDLGDYHRIGDPVLRKFTQAAFECQIPVVLGGHSVVSGGMMVLIDSYLGQQSP